MGDVCSLLAKLGAVKRAGVAEKQERGLPPLFLRGLFQFVSRIFNVSKDKGNN